MSYLLDKKIQKQKIISVSLIVLVLLGLFYFRAGIYRGLSYLGEKVFHPVFVVSNSLGGKFGELKAYFLSKNSLYRENQNLQAQLNTEEATMANYNAVVADNQDLQNILNNKNPKSNLVLAAILAKPNASPYDTLLINAGGDNGVMSGDTVFAAGNIPIGQVDTVDETSAKVILFSSPGEDTQGVLAGGNIFMDVIGRGGGNFEIAMPQGLNLQAGDQVDLPGLTPYVLGTVQTVLSDPRDPVAKALLTSPVNIQSLKFVEVEE